MSQITVRDIPEDVLLLLREEAAGGHTSLNAVILAALADHAERRSRRLRLQRLLPEFDALQQHILEARGGQVTTDSALLLREDRGR